MRVNRSTIGLLSGSTLVFLDGQTISKHRVSSDVIVGLPVGFPVYEFCTTYLQDSNEACYCEYSGFDVNIFAKEVVFELVLAGIEVLCVSKFK